LSGRIGVIGLTPQTIQPKINKILVMRGGWASVPVRVIWWETDHEN